MTKKRNKRKQIKVQDSSVVSGSAGAGGSGDKTRDYRANQDVFGLLSQSDKTIPFCAGMRTEPFFYLLWRRFWEARKIVNIPAYDMTREGWEYVNQDLDPEIIKKIDNEAEKIQLNTEIYKALEYERKYGGSVIIIGNSEDNDNPEEPLSPDSLKQGGLKFIRALSRAIVSVSEYETDPFSPDYAKPKKYMIRGKNVDKSRLLVFDGGGMDDPEAIGFTGMSSFFNIYDGFGVSVLESLFDDIIRAVGARKAAFQLINNASILIFKRTGDTKLTDATMQGEYNMNSIKNIMDQLSIYRSAILDKGSEISNYAATFGSTPELLISYLQVLSAASDIPAARFLGESPGGLNANGKGELKNYYDHIRAQQQIRLKPQLFKLLPFLEKSALGKIYNGFDIEFNPLFQNSPTEQAAINNQNWMTISNALMSGVGDETWASKEALEKGIFLNDPMQTDDGLDEEGDVLGGKDKDIE